MPIKVSLTSTFKIVRNNLEGTGTNTGMKQVKHSLLTTNQKLFLGGGTMLGLSAWGIKDDQKQVYKNNKEDAAQKSANVTQAALRKAEAVYDLKDLSSSARNKSTIKNSPEYSAAERRYTEAKILLEGRETEYRDRLIQKTIPQQVAEVFYRLRKYTSD